MAFSPISLIQFKISSFRRIQGVVTINKNITAGTSITSCRMDPVGKIALVTGAASGIGMECARILLQNGAKVMLCDIDNKQGNQVTQQFGTEFGAKTVHFLHCDVTDSEEFEIVFQKTVEMFGALNILVNNAGILDEDNWQKTVAINLIATIQGTMLALKFMSPGAGVVVNVASVVGLRGEPGSCVYSATKHGVVGLSTSYGHAQRFSRTKVRVVAVCPGRTESNLVVNTTWQQDCWKDIPIQKTENVARAVLHVIKEAKSGTVWVSMLDEPVYQFTTPDKETFRGQ